jgi:hypothetical protein
VSEHTRANGFAIQDIQHLCDVGVVHGFTLGVEHKVFLIADTLEIFGEYGFEFLGIWNTFFTVMFGGLVLIEYELLFLEVDVVILGLVNVGEFD